MKKNRILLTAFTMLLAFTSFAQNPQLTWGDEFKLKKGSTNLKVIHSDETGVYLEEGHLKLKSYYVIGGSVRTSARLVKLDKKLNEVFNADFDKELKGKEFEQFFVLGKKLFIIGTSYKKNALTIYAAEVNKRDGFHSGVWTELKTIYKDDKKDGIDFNLVYSSDSTKMLLVSTVAGKEKSNFSIQEFDQNLRASAKEVIIANEFEKKFFRLEDIVYTPQKRIIVVGRKYEYQDGKKKKEKFLDFKNYNIRMYDEKGKQLKEFTTTIDGKWINNAGVTHAPGNDVVLAAFYSADKKTKTIDGILVQRIDPLSGEVKSTTERKIDHSQLAATAEDDDEEDDNESRRERKEREALEKLMSEEEGFSNQMRFRKIHYTPEGGLLLIAEKYRVFVQMYSRPAPGGGITYDTRYVYDSGDLLITNVNNQNNIEFIKMVPKFQREIYGGSYIPKGAGHVVSGFFDKGGFPFYSSINSIIKDNSLIIYFNDNPKNESVTQAGQKIKIAYKFNKSHLFALTINLQTGSLTRKFISSNADMATAMPRSGSIVNDDFYLIGMDMKLMSRTKIAVGKITLKK